MHLKNLTGTQKGGRIFLHFGKDLPSSVLNNESKAGIETIYFKINLRKRKWFLNCSCDPNKNLISNHLECLNRYYG